MASLKIHFEAFDTLIAFGLKFGTLNIFILSLDNNSNIIHDVEAF